MLRIPLHYSILTLLPLFLLPSCFSWPVMAADPQQQTVFQSPHDNQSIPFTEPWLRRLEYFYKTFGQQQGIQRWIHDQQCAYSLPDFQCEPYDYDDGLAERDAYHLRPQDIELMISLGDSITAGFGMLSGRPPFASAWEYRGKVFAIGGDPDEDYTLPALWSPYSIVAGPSYGVTLPLSRGKQLNNAVSGAKAQDLDLQVSRLVRQLQKPDYIKNKHGWKMITLFIGANNVCVLCTPPITQLPGMAEVDVFEIHVRSAVERLRTEVGYAFVNLVALFNVSSVYEAARGNPYCEMVLDPSHMVVCSCLQADERKRQAADLVVKGYNERLHLIAQDYQELHDPHFAVTYQPGFNFFPVGKYKQRYLSGIDCFHPNRCANQVMAMVLWNNMFSSQEEKLQPYHVHNLTFVCPGTQRPYLQSQTMFRHRISSPITDESHNSSFQSGKASIIGMRKSDSLDAPTHQQPYHHSEEYQYQYQYGEHLHQQPAAVTDTTTSARPPLPREQVEEPLTIESMSAVIAAAVQMSGTTGAKSSLSMGHASIKQMEKKTQSQDEKGKRRFSLFSWKKQQQQQQQQQRQQQQHVDDDTTVMDSRVDSTLSFSSSASSTSSSPRSSSSAVAASVVTTPVDDGLDELAYRGIQIKEIKTTLKPMVIPSDVTNPMPAVKLERPGFARINY